MVTVETLQLSSVVESPRFTLVAVHSSLVETLTFAGASIVGKVSSVTVTVCVAVAVFPLASVTVQVTIVSPTSYVVGASLVAVEVSETDEKGAVAKCAGLLNVSPSKPQPLST